MTRFILGLMILCFTTVSLAKTVHVKGYTRKDGTYVRPHIRSSPDSVKWNNYGSSSTSVSKDRFSYEDRDQDRDGIPNYRDHDDDNDGVLDDDE